MKKVIERKVYDTSKAELIGGFSSGFSSDHNYVSEELYVTENGRYFLYVEGGPNSRYREHCGNNTWASGEDIIALGGREDAIEWAENHSLTKVLLENFSEELEEA